MGVAAAKGESRTHLQFGSPGVGEFTQRLPCEIGFEVGTLTCPRALIALLAASVVPWPRVVVMAGMRGVRGCGVAGGVVGFSFGKSFG